MSVRTKLIGACLLDAAVITIMVAVWLWLPESPMSTALLALLLPGALAVAVMALTADHDPSDGDTGGGQS